MACSSRSSSKRVWNRFQLASELVSTTDRVSRTSRCSRSQRLARNSRLAAASSAAPSSRLACFPLIGLPARRAARWIAAGAPGRRVPESRSRGRPARSDRDGAPTVVDRRGRGRAVPDIAQLRDRDLDRVVVERARPEAGTPGTQAVEKARAEHAREGADTVGEGGRGAQLVDTPAQQLVAIEASGIALVGDGDALRVTVSSTSPSGGASRVTAPTGPDAASSARPASCIASRRPGIYSPLTARIPRRPCLSPTRDIRPPKAGAVLPSYHQQRQSVADADRALRPPCPDGQPSAMTDA